MPRAIPRSIPAVLAAALIAGLLLVATPMAPAAQAVGDITDTINIRLPGSANDPGRVALRLSLATFDDGGADRVLLATEDNFADALASGALQGNDSPLLLTAPDDVRADVGNEIDRLGVGEVVMLGGTAALDESVADELAASGVNVRRLDGATRFHTAAEIAATAMDASTDTVLISRAFGSSADPSQAFADSLSAGGMSAATGWPILLATTEELPEPTRTFITQSEIETVVVLGGPAAISDAVIEELNSLGVQVERVFGPTRFATAVGVANFRGISGADEAPEIILVEGQEPDAWAGGFAAAARSAREGAPILLANGPTLPPETVEFLAANQFAVDVDAVTDPVLICVADALACDEARRLLGLPTEAAVTIEEPEGGIPSRSAAVGTISLSGFDAQVAVFGACIQDGLLPVGEDGSFALDVQDAPGVCDITFEVTFTNGSVQTFVHPLNVAPTVPQTGPVVDTETGGDTYTFVPAEATAAQKVTYLLGERFIVDGESATVGAFEAALTVADIVTYTADTAEGTIHDLTNVDPASLNTGMLGNVNLAAGNMAIIEPVSGVALRPGLSVQSADSLLFVDNSRVNVEEFSGSLSEGDQIRITNDTVAITNASVAGTVGRITADQVSGIVRFAVGNLGDDPTNSEDERFRIVEGSEMQRYTVDGLISTFSRLAGAISEGDEVSYRRAGGVENFDLRNRARPAVTGLVTETADPDGSPIAPEPEDGGDLTLVTAMGRTAISYSPTAQFRIDDRLATEEEMEAVLTPGDAVTFQPRDDATSTVESLTLTNRDLVGDVADIAEGANTLDVLTLAGIVYDDLNYTSAIFGGEDTYLVDGDLVSLLDFEDQLGLIDDGEQLASIVVRPAGGGTEYRLTILET